AGARRRLGLAGAVVDLDQDPPDRADDRPEQERHLDQGPVRRAEPGAYRITVDRNKCEGKRDCVEVCPYGVLEVRRIDDADFARLSWIGKLKSRAHGRQTAYTPRLDQCQACGLCVVACPEHALTLERIAPR
ncbi:MAG TPA: ferredoxin family protein, partial [Kofleriaceae bacterium]|nr:ferredoxin family protein [Kofleriaceae bacterium]